jgi:hypothetical protein
MVEVGGGDGAWARALGIPSYDIDPKAESVILGNHQDAAATAASALLMVWPPDGTAAQAWVEAKDWRYVVFIGSPLRVTLNLSRYALIERLRLPAGRKGGNTILVYERRP